MSAFRTIILSFMALGIVSTAAAQDVYVPDELEGWQDWVLEGKEHRRCPMIYDRQGQAPSDFVCTWPSVLDLDVNADGGGFEQTWRVVAGESWIPLPGNAEYWPENVRANGQDVAVVLKDGRPGVHVSAGSYRLTGRFVWEKMPGALPLPPETGLISLTLDGRNIDRPGLDRNGVFLGRRTEVTPEARDAVSVDVYRLVEDAVPTRLVTRMRLDVSGSVREELFGPVLPESFVPVALESALPARLEPDGRLRVQVRPGRWQLTLTARAPGVLDALSLPGDAVSLPDQEIWSYRANERLRVTSAEGPPPVDPQQVDVPQPWSGLPAFRMGTDAELLIVERSRGIVGAENSLSLNRAMWLDFDGDGFVVRDRIGGTMRTGWRLDMQTPFELRSASEGDENLLITKGDEPGETGIEVRQADVALVTLAENTTRGSMPVTGWESRFANVSTELYLPPGSKLLAAPGADVADGSWAGQWQLLDFFLVLIITIAAYRLFGLPAGIIALAAMTLSYQEANAPSWLWLNLLIAAALLRVAPAGRLKTAVRVYLGASGILLVLALVPFIAGQLRIAIYPQLEPQWQTARYSRMPEVPPDLQWDAPETGPVQGKIPESRIQATTAEALEELSVASSPPGRQYAPAKYARYAPSAIVQAGPGIPTWEWNANRLRWSGPVEPDQTLTLMILPRWLVTAVRFAEVLLLLAFAAVIAAEIFRQRWRLPGGFAIGRTPAAVLVFAVAGMFATAAQTAGAQTPDAELLRELERRLLAPPECAPRCAEIASATVEVRGETVLVRLDIDALDAVAVPLPGSPDGWRPGAVAIDSSGGGEVFRGPAERYWLRLPAGRHAVRLQGPTAGTDSVEIAFPTPPRTISVEAEGWFVAGVRDRRLVSGALQLTRQRQEESEDESVNWEGNRFPPFVRVERNLELGLDWRVMTRVERVAPAEGAITMEIPLLDGESVVSGDFEQRDGGIVVSLAPGQRSVAWQSNLERASPLTLSSEDGVPWTEFWRVAVGAIWHVDFDGVPASESGSLGSGIRFADFHPRGGEALALTATQPEPAEGDTLAFDAVELDVQQGARSRSATIRLDYRSTRGDQHVIRLPDGAEVTRVVLDGEDEPLRPVDGALTVPILPGKHSIFIEWRRDDAGGAVTTTPAVDLGAPSSNLKLGLTLPRNRWLLATDGPRLGPAVLYWSELAVFVLFALLLGRIDWTPLRTHHWLLLGLGFSTFNWPVFGLVALWLLVVGARDRWRIEGDWWQFNLQQAAIVVLTIVALIGIVVSLPLGLLGTPDMHVVGNNSFDNSLSWFADRAAGTLPAASAVSVPLWIYKVLILAWALWLSFALLKWLPWTWRCFARDGFFRKRGDAGAGEEET